MHEYEDAGPVGPECEETTFCHQWGGEDWMEGEWSLGTIWNLHYSYFVFHRVMFV